MELFFAPFIIFWVLIVLPFIAIPKFIEVGEKAKEEAERENLSKTELKQDQKKNNDNSP